MPTKNILKKHNLEIGDMIIIEFSNHIPTKQKYGYITEWDLENNRGAIYLEDHSEFIIDQENKWNMCILCPVEAKSLTKLGFTPQSEIIAYEKTQELWNKKEYGKIWSLNYNKESSKWELSIYDFDDKIINCQILDSEIVYIHQLQHYMRNWKNSI